MQKPRKSINAKATERRGHLHSGLRPESSLNSKFYEIGPGSESKYDPSERPLLDYIDQTPTGNGEAHSRGFTVESDAANAFNTQPTCGDGETGNLPFSLPDPSEFNTDVETFLRILHPDGVCEIRSPKCPVKKGNSFTTTHSGYFNDMSLAAKQVASTEKLEPPGIYVTLNAVDPSLLARANNRIIPKAEKTTSKTEVVCRQWLLVDIDPKRRAGISSTDKELEAAWQLSDNIRATMLEAGWPEPLRGMSGNGTYLLWRVKLPNNEESEKLVQRVLKALASRFNTVKAEVDTSTYDASRICKVLGTMARKGDSLSTNDSETARPHRRSGFITPTAELGVVSIEQLTELGGLQPESEKHHNASFSNGASYDVADLERARKYIAKMPTAVEGEKGSDNLFAVACKLVIGFGLSEADAMQILIGDYNPRCIPPWSEKELLHKVRDAALKRGERGALLHKPRPSQYQPPRVDMQSVDVNSSLEKRVPKKAKCDPPADPCPVHLFPEVMSEYIIEGAKSRSTDESLVMLPVLTVVAAAIGNVRLIAANGSWKEPPVVWGAVVAKSGSLKSPGIDLARELAEPVENASRRDFAEVEKKYHRDFQSYEKALQKWKRSKSACLPPEPPEEPHEKRLLIDDTTYEAVAAILSKNPRGVAAIYDELPAWLNGMGAYSRGSGAGRDISRWLQLFHCRPLKIDRKKAPKTIHCPTASVWLVGAIQPDMLALAMAKDTISSGMLARFVFVIPTPRPKRWADFEMQPAVRSAMQDVISRLRLLDFEVDEKGEQQPVVLSLTDEARQRFANFVDAHGAETFFYGNDLSAAWSKLEGYVLRFALVFHLARWASGDESCSESGPVGLDSIEHAIELARWFGDEAKRVYAEIGVGNGQMADGDHEDGRLPEHIERLIEWLRSKGGSATEREISRGPSRYRVRKRLDDDCQELIAAGRAVWNSGPKTRRIELLDNVTSPIDDDSSPVIAKTGQLSPSEGAESCHAVAAKSNDAIDTATENLITDSAESASDIKRPSPVRNADAISSQKPDGLERGII